VELRNYKITLDQVHYSEFDKNTLDGRSLDFVVLSPQGTPWHMYKEKAERELGRAKETLTRIIDRGRTPILAICGGHQFLALAFGGKVDFIDPNFVGSYPEQYPKEALREQGVVELETLAADPIFQGVVSHPGRFRVVQNHCEEVKTLPREFVNLAKSEISEIQILRAPGKVVYGVAFHPERGWNATNRAGEAVPEGKRILANFFLMVARAKK
jgi:GMP synthase (glutamine-hydrolysing)